MSDQNSQTHPLYAKDRDQVDALLGHQGEPGPEQLTVAARLIMRYGDFPGAEDLKNDILKVVKSWGLDFQALNDIDTIIPVPFPRSVVTSNVSVVQGKGIIIIINMLCKMFTHCEVRHRFTTKLQEWKVYRQK